MKEFAWKSHKKLHQKHCGISVVVGTIMYSFHTKAHSTAIMTALVTFFSVGERLTGLQLID